MVKRVGAAEIEAFGRDGCVLLPGLLTDTRRRWRRGSEPDSRIEGTCQLTY